MRFVASALSLTLLLSAPAAALPLGAPTPPGPTDVDRFNGPSTGNLERTGLFTQKTAMERLRQVCSSSALKDRRTCDRAWKEINAAYAQLQTSRAAQAAQTD